MTKELLKIERSYWSVTLLFDPHKLWVGLFWKKHWGPRIDLYLTILPTFPLLIVFVYRNVFKTSSRQQNLTKNSQQT